ncbi:low temperature requirement protein A [Pseudonocardia xinjiangensis]|uniref:Low temperature requirement protein A n=1 Tax=Pseudonocardia xinjiangensis TaxID=75289 RepID=A0ABX1RAN1_9PSEU|nr:low temperature requirement protein A [Pseudonocardia xinjiangensis]
MVTPRRTRFESLSEGATVTTLELFFDLVFVFALTRVTDWMAEDSSAEAVLRGVLILVVMWWSWVAYSWLGNVAKADEGLIRLGMFVAMAAVFVGAITIPEAFNDLPGGLSGPVVFAVAYFCVRAVHLAMYWVCSRGDAQLRAQIVRVVPAAVLGTVLLLVASQTEGWVQTALWAAAIIGDYVGTAVAGASWRLNSASHFAERHGLIIIVALGESIVSIGIGVAELPISWPIIVAGVLGLAVAGALWWIYFDVVTLRAEHALAEAGGERQIRMARGGYTYLHLPMVIGIILMSLGLKKVLLYIGGGEGHTIADPLYGIPLAALYGGAVLYLFAHVGFTWYVLRTANPVRLVVGAVLLAVMPLVAGLPAIGTLGFLAAVLSALVAYEVHRYREVRQHVRHVGPA